MKYKADSLQKSGEYETAILVYQSIINREWDNSISKIFYGRVYASLGAAYGSRFLYEEAAKVYLFLAWLSPANALIRFLLSYSL